MNNLWHTKSSTAIIEKLGSSEHGLSNAEATLRLKQYGQNKKSSKWKIPPQIPPFPFATSKFKEIL